MTMVLDTDARGIHSDNRGTGQPSERINGRQLPLPNPKFFGRVTALGENKPDAKTTKEI